MSPASSFAVPTAAMPCKVPQVTARTFHRMLPSGATRPSLFFCVDGEESTGEYVVKSHGELGSRILCEMMAWLVARALSMKVPSMALVEIPFLLLPYIPDAAARQTITPGLHIGTRYLSGASVVFPQHRVTDAQIEQAVQVFAFDMLIQNVDRTNGVKGGKPNLLQCDSTFWLIDHEKAFAFLTDVDQRGDTWTLRDRPFPRDHIFYSLLRGQQSVSFENFMARIEVLSDPLIDDMCDFVPSCWQDGDSLPRIAHHLSTVRSEAAAFEQQLKEVIACGT